MIKDNISVEDLVSIQLTRGNKPSYVPPNTSYPDEVNYSEFVKIDPNLTQNDEDLGNSVA